jgi:hypothetical protein
MNNTLANGFSDIEVPVVDGGTNDSTTLSLTFNGEDQGAKGTVTPDGTAGAITAWVRVNDASRDETFRLRPRVTGYKALPAAITIDGVTVQPSIRLEGEDATASAWTDVVNGTSFVLAGSGADPTFDEGSPGIDCKRVKFNGAKYYLAAASSVGAIGTNDFVIEFVLQYNGGSVVYIVNKIDPVSGLADALLFYMSSGSLLTYIDSAGGAAIDHTWITGLTIGAYYHVIAFFDRSGNARAYINGAAGTAVSIAAFASDSLAVNGRWALGANGTNGGNPMISGMSYFALWTRASWLSTASQLEVASRRFAQCCGTYAETAQQVDLLVDGDMETAGTGAWGVFAAATLSKETASPQSGSQNLKVLYNGNVSCYAKQAILLAGYRYHMTGYARSDGNMTPLISTDAATVWIGTRSTSWQAFDFSFTNTSGTTVYMGGGASSGQFTEWDSIEIYQDGAIPSAQTRSTIANLEKWNIAETESYLIPVGANWLRTDKIKCADATFKIGARLEQAQTNLFLYSEDFSDAAWAKTRVTLGTSITGLGSLTFNAIIASVDNATHLVSQGVTTAASEDHVFSIYAKAGAGTVNSIRIELDEDTTQYVYCNLATGEIGDVGAGFTLTAPAHIYPKGDGYYRCDFRPTTPGTAATINIYLSNGSTAGSETFTGDGTSVGVYLAGAQFERQLGSSQHTGSPSSYVKTTSATVTRVKDLALYRGYENCGGLNTKNVHMKVDHVCLAFANNYVGLRTAGSLTSKSADDRSEIYSDMSTKKWNAIAVTGGTTQASLAATTSTPFDNNLQTTEACFAKNNVSLVVSKTVEARDTSATINPMTEIVVGASTGYLYHIDGIITDFTLSPYGTEYPRAIFALDKDAYTQQAFVGYDMLDEDALTYELRAGGGTTRLVTMNGGTLTAGTWYLISLEWTGETSVRIRVDGSSVDTATADATIAELTDLFIAWAGLAGYVYEPASGDPDYPITYGAISIADVQHHVAVPPAAWYTEMVARGVPAKHPDLIHQISQVAHETATHYDLLSGTEGARTPSGAVPPYVPPTEIGLALGTNEANGTIIDFGTNFQFMQEASHSYDAWIRVDGSGDQCIWANGDANTTDFQALLYDNATDSLAYKCVIGSTLRSVSAEIELDRLYHVTVTRDYDSGAGTTTIAIYLDAVAADIQIYSGAPVVTNDDFVMLSTSESGGVFTLPFIGATVGNRFYDDVLTQAEIDAIYLADSAVILNGPYATQTIIPATLPATISGAVKPDGINGYPIVLVQEDSGGAWRAIATAESETGYSEFSKQTKVNDFRLYAKGYNTYEPVTAYFDDLDGGDDPGEFTIGIVEVAKNKRKALENLVLVHKPLHSWAVMVVKYI